jgi:hypothetical protein
MERATENWKKTQEEDRRAEKRGRYLSLLRKAARQPYMRLPLLGGY